MKDRQPYPGKEGLIKHTPCDINGVATGAPAYYAKLDMADSPLEQGSTWSKGNVAPDALSNALGLTDPQSADIANTIRKLAGCVTTATASNTITAGDLVDLSGSVATKSFHATLFPDITCGGTNLSGTVKMRDNVFLRVTYNNSTKVATLQIGELKGKSFVFGNAVTVSMTAQPADLQLCKIGDTKYAISYRLNIESSYPGYVLAFDASGLTIQSVGAPVSIGVGIHSPSGVSTIGTDKFLYWYQRWNTSSTDSLHICVCTVSGLTVTAGTLSDITGTAIGRAVALSATKAVALCGYGTTTKYRVLDISGATLTVGAEKVLKSTELFSNYGLLSTGRLAISYPSTQALYSFATDTLTVVNEVAVPDDYGYRGNPTDNSVLLCGGNNQPYKARTMTDVSGMIVLSPVSNITTTDFGAISLTAALSQGALVALSTGSHAMALQSATTGQQLEVAQDGATYAPGLVAGQYYLSDGIEGYVYATNFISLTGFWKRKE